ncbi:MAG: glycosyltransferase [Paludibacteraceae bacterium]|nr:glycosyltransferase [Paludibacteraceae bacterium]
MKILINTPSLRFCGGVANHFMGLRSFWTERVKYNCVGKRIRNTPWLTYLILPFDILKFIIRLLLFRPDIVMVNPSMAPKAIKRDFTYLKIARFFGFKVSIMFHGFHTESVMDMKPYIVEQLNKTCLIFVLAKEFKTILEEWGVTVPIELTTTKVDDRMLDGFSIDQRQGKVENILFLARVTKAKGIMLALEVFKELSHKYPSLKYTVVGDGADLDEAKAYVKDKAIPNVTFTGALSGKKLVAEFKRADLYLFTSYHEGMPTSVLEAMAFGLPVVTHPVGGMVDFFDENMGYTVNTFEAADFVPPIADLIKNQEKTKRISVYNHQYAHDHFLASMVAQRMEKIFYRYI